MKKSIALLLCLVMALISTVSLAEGNDKTSIGLIDVNGAFELRCTVPEGYEIRDIESPMDNGVLAKWIGSEDQTRPIMVLFIAFDELLAEVERLNDLDEDALRQIEQSFTEEDEVEITYCETAYGTKLMVVREALDEIDFVDFYTIYKGHEIEFLLMSGIEATEPLNDAQIQMAIDFLSNLDFVNTEDALAGVWYDETSERATMEIMQMGDGLYWVEILWSSSADETTAWYMTGTLTEEGTLTYADGAKVDGTYGEDGEIIKAEVQYTDAEGTLSLADGVISWTDSKEETAPQFVFRQAED